jgi:hypothetical protein
MMMKEENQFEVPFQVQTLITSLSNKNERVHIRGNYRMRLEGIKRAIDNAILEYDREMGTAPQKMFYPKGKR